MAPPLGGPLAVLDLGSLVVKTEASACFDDASTRALRAMSPEASNSASKSGILGHMRIAWSWHDAELRPSSHDDVAELVRLARRARQVRVDFHWELSRDDLVALRSGIREWISKEVGRYRAFDRRVLESIDATLAEGSSSLAERSRSEAGDVACFERDGFFHVTGGTSFDIALGYASTAANPGAIGTIHLPQHLRTAMVESVAALGWDPRLLTDEQYRPVRNVIFGFAVGRGARDVAPRGEPLLIDVRFEGPFALVADSDAPCLFGEPVASRPGIYLWAVRARDGFRPWYVGQTARTFAGRTAEHVAGYLAGEYVPHDLASIATGEFRRIEGHPRGEYPSSLPEFLDTLPARLPRILEVLRETRLFVAPLDGGKRALDRVEGALGRHYKNTLELKNFLTPGQRVPDAIPGDRPLVVTLASAAKILGLPSELREPR